MSRITLGVMICFVLTRTAAPCCAELFSVEVPDLEGNYGGLGAKATKANSILAKSSRLSTRLGCT